MESIESLNTTTSLCPYCKNPIFPGAFVCGHCLNNLQSRKSTIINNQLPVWFIGLLACLLVATFILPVLRFSSGAFIRYKLKQLNNRPREAQAMAAMDEKTTPAPTKIPMAENVCLKPDEVTKDHLGQEICVQGNVDSYRLDDRGIFRIRFDKNLESLMLIDDERTYDVTRGQCIKIRDVVIEWSGLRVIELNGELPECD